MPTQNRVACLYFSSVDRCVRTTLAHVPQIAEFQDCAAKNLGDILGKEGILLPRLLQRVVDKVSVTSSEMPKGVLNQ
jgi:hypothetical protein